MKSLLSIQLVLALAVSWLVACGDDGDDKKPACSESCESGQTQCAENEVQRCEEDDQGCFQWVDAETCERGAETCRDGECKPCPDGCCGACDPYVCGPRSDDGCGRTCGGAVSANEHEDEVLEAVCGVVKPCSQSENITGLPFYASIEECKYDFRSMLRGDVNAWCSDLVERCLKATVSSSCDIATDLADCLALSSSDVRLDTGACENPDEKRCGDLGECLDTRSNAEHCGICGMQCGDGAFCEAGKCVACGAPGQPCCEGDLCQDSTCIDGTCDSTACKQPVGPGSTTAGDCHNDNAIKCGTCTDLRCYQECSTFCGSCAIPQVVHCIQENAPDCVDEIRSYECCLADCQKDHAEHFCRGQCSSEAEALDTCYGNGKGDCLASSGPASGCFSE